MMPKLADLLDEFTQDELWLWVSTDGSDKLFETHITNRCSSNTYALASNAGITLITSELDADIDLPFSKLVYRTRSQVDTHLASVLETRKWPKRIYLNFSQSGDHKVDSLGHGVFVLVTSKITKLYELAGKDAPTFLSAEEHFYKLIERRTEQELEKQRIAADRALWIIRESFSLVKPGMSEKSIVDLFHTVSERSRAQFISSSNILREEYSWEAEGCPIVLAGPSLAKGGHADSSELRIQPGFTLYADFGVKLFFDDGGIASSDLQRMAYLPKAGETSAPQEIQRVFETLYNSISAGLKALVPGNYGYQVDEAARAIIADAGFPDYNHATGHPVAEVAHSPGTLLAPKENIRGNRTIQASGTYTVEPRIQIENGGSIEEMAVATAQGGIPLCARQEHLWIIGVNI
jgi:Xaa-Pro aminopeptidase